MGGVVVPFLTAIIAPPHVTRVYRIIKVAVWAGTHCTQGGVFQ